MNRLLFFPEPYPDEDFRSLIYRYHLKSSNHHLMETNKELFGKKSRKISLFPTKMEALFERMPYGNSYNLNELIFNHTHSGLILAFMRTEKRKEFLNIIKKGTQNPLWVNNNFASDLFSKTIEYCPLCMKEDYEKFGECYIHRNHQLQFMNFCPIHYVRLIDHCPSCDSNLNSRGLTSHPFCGNNHDLRTEHGKKIEKDKETKLKVDLFTLICQIKENYNHVDSKVIYHKILMGLWEKKNIHYKGRILKKELISKLISFYGVDTLNSIMNIDSISHKSFLDRILVKDLNQHILFYTLLIHYLFNSFERFLSAEIEIANHIPFGNGPWKCVNKICDGYNQKIISRVKRSAKVSGGMVISGEFLCPLCGQIYLKRWNGREFGSGKVMIKTMGQKWIDKVLDLYLIGYSANQIAIELKCSEFAVRNNLDKIIGFSRIIKRNEKEVVSQIISTQLEIASATDLEVKKESYRSHILDIIEKDGTLTRTDIYRKAVYKYQWLKMNDGEWLEVILPTKVRMEKQRLDFKFFDKELAKKIKVVSNELIRKGYHCQIKKNTILKRLTSVERTRLNSKNSVRLPLSSLALRESIEPLNCYLIRRLPILIERLLRKGLKKISLNTLRNHSAIYGKCDPETEAIIKDLLNKIGYFE